MATFDHYAWADKLPDASLDVSAEHHAEFFRTMFERQMIWKRRFLDQAPRPWTEDPILRDYKFTNVYRELDRNSQWQIRNILLDDSLSLTDLVWKMMVFRYFNNPRSNTPVKSTAGEPAFRITTTTTKTSLPK